MAEAEVSSASDGATASQPVAAYPSRGRRIRRRIRRFTIMLCILVFIVIGGVAVLFDLTPPVSKAQALAQALARAHDVQYPGPAVPARFARALVATEDHRFYSEPGIDPFAAGRVLVGWLDGNGGQQGGSTLDQQLAKMLYTSGRTGLGSLAEQVVLGVKLNFAYSKAQILQMYAGIAYFGHGYYGLATASCGYFGVVPARLTWPQAAMLAGLVQAPSVYDPLAHPGLAREREAHVLGRLTATGMLTQAEASMELKAPLGLVTAQPGRLAVPVPVSDTCRTSSGSTGSGNTGSGN